MGDLDYIYLPWASAIFRGFPAIPCNGGRAQRREVVTLNRQEIFGLFWGGGILDTVSSRGHPWAPGRYPESGYSAPWRPNRPGYARPKTHILRFKWDF